MPPFNTFEAFPVNSTIFIPTVSSTLHDALEAWQNWSDVTFDDKYRTAILTLVEGLAALAGYFLGFVYCWLLLQLVKTARYWLAEAVQAVPVLNGWWVAPSVEIAATQYPEYCWQAMAPAVTNAILNDEMKCAVAAEDTPTDIS
jgi:hypothetical protein